MSHPETYEACQVLAGHPEGVAGIAFSPDDSSILAGDYEGTAHVWGLSRGEERLRLEGHLAAVSGVAWSRGGKRWLTGGRRTAHLWDAVADAEITRFREADRPVTCTAFFPDGQTAVYACGSSSYHDEKSGAFFCLHRPAYLVIIDLLDHREIRRFEAATGLIRSLEITPDGSGMLTVHSCVRDRGVTLWDAESGEARQQVRRVWTNFEAALVPGSPDALVAWEKRVDFWSLKTGEFRPALPAVDYSVTCLAVTPNGRIALTSHALYEERVDQPITVWDLREGRCLGELKGHREDVRVLTVSHDGRRAASASKDGAIRLWDLTVFETSE